MLASLYNAPSGGKDAVGTAAIGSSEAIMLGGLALKMKWQARRRAEGKPTDKPNLIMGYNVQVCWEKVRSHIAPSRPPSLSLSLLLSLSLSLSLSRARSLHVSLLTHSKFTRYFGP